MAVQIQLRHDTAAAWTTANPTLLAGEVGFETDTGKFKIGTGSSAWIDLSYATDVPAEIDAAIASALASLVDSAPGTLDTLNELAAALGDDPNFATTISSQIALKADDSALSAHTGSTTSVHGIADTAALETQTGAQSKADAAQTAAQSYADGLAPNYDPAGSASTAQAAAQAYADSLAPNYDPSGSASSAQTAAQSYTDSVVGALTTDSVPEGTNQYYTDERAQDAAAALFTSGTHTNITVSYDDVAGSLSLTGAEGYASADFDTDLASKTSDDVTEGASNLYFTNARALSATASAYDPAGSAATAESNANAYADGLAVNYDPVGSAATAQTAAEAYAASLAPNYDPAGSASAAQTAAEAYADSLAVNYDPAGSAAAAQSAAETYADNAAATAAAAVVDTAPTTLDTLNELAAALGDDPNFATTVATQIGTKADAASLSSHESATTSVHGIADTSALETQTGAQSKADAAQSAAQAYADSLAVNYDAVGSAATAESNANSYTDTAIASFEALPSQTGNSGKYLTTDGASTSWAAVPNPSLTTYVYTCVAGQTVFTGTDDNSAELSFTGSNIAVYLNGVFLTPGIDYTTSTNTVTLVSGADASDVIAALVLA